MGVSSNAMMLPGNSSWICAGVRLGWMTLTAGSVFSMVSRSNDALARERDTTVTTVIIASPRPTNPNRNHTPRPGGGGGGRSAGTPNSCLLYTSDAADDLLCVDLRGRR